MKNSFGKRFSDLRKQKGLTQEDIAVELNVSAQAVSKWENDISFPDITLLLEISELLGVTVDELLGKEGQVSPIVYQDKEKNINNMLLRIVILSKQGDKVKVNLPLQLIKIGLETGLSMPQIKGNKSLQDIDFKQILELVEQGVMGKLVEIESAEGDIVEIFVE